VRAHAAGRAEPQTGIARDPAQDSEAIRFLGSATNVRLLNNLPPLARCTTTSRQQAIGVRLLPSGPSYWSTTTSRWMQRHYEHLPASTGNGATGASGTGPSAGYTFMFLFLFTSFLVWLTGNKMEYIYMSSQHCCYFHKLNLTRFCLII
jgi:hypothetical protein